MNKLIVWTSLWVFLFVGCKKDKSGFARISNIQVVNAVINSPGIKVNTAGKQLPYSLNTQLNYAANAYYFVERAQTPIEIVSVTDTLKPVFKQSIDFLAPVYSIILLGTSPMVETFIKEESDLPFTRIDVASPDSIVNIRFANFSPGSDRYNIRIANSSVGEATSLAFKDISAFKAYPAKSTNSSYSFQVRDAQTDVLLVTYNFTVSSTNRFKNIMLAIKGLRGTTTGVNAFGIFPVNYF